MRIESCEHLCLEVSRMTAQRAMLDEIPENRSSGNTRNGDNASPTTPDRSSLHQPKPRSHTIVGVRMYRQLMASSHQPMETVADAEQLVIAAEWYEQMCIAAAKLSVVAGASAAEAQRASGLQRVEINRALGPVKRQTNRLDKAAVLAGEDIPRHLVAPEQVLSSQGTALAGDYLQISNYARYKRALFLYRKAINDLNQEFNKISAEYFALKDKFERFSNDYDVLGATLNELIKSSVGRRHPSMEFMHDHVRKFSWAKRDQIIQELEPLIRQRDCLRAQLSKAAGRLSNVMAVYQRHHARRAYLRSSVIREYSDYKSLFVPRATLYGMSKFDFDNTLTTRPDEVEKMLQLAEQWNQIQIAFAAERKNMKIRHRHDESNDHALYRVIQARATNSSIPTGK